MDFKNGVRKDPLMTPRAALLAPDRDAVGVAAEMTDTEITAVFQYIQGLTQ